MQEKMDNLKKNIGRRLKEVRLFVFDGMTVSHFAEILHEKSANISNYEQGKANIPNRVLVELYYRGINPIYILTGEGEKRRAEIIEQVQDEVNINHSKLQYLLSKADEMTAVAGDIIKYVKEQSKSEDDSSQTK